MIDFDTPVDRIGTGSLKWNHYNDPHIDPAWVADMDFLSPEPVRNALHQRIDHGIFGYTLPQQSLIEAILEYLWSTYHWRVDASSIVWLPGLVTGLNVACRSIGELGDEVLTFSPIYGPFLAAPNHSGRQRLISPMILVKGRWKIDWEQLANIVTRKTKLLLFCSPQNPTGRLFERDELEQLSQFCLERNLILCSDEIHCDLVLESNRRHIPTATISPEIEDRTITLMAPSKTYNIPGLGCSFAIIPNKEIRRRFQHAMRGIVPYVNTLGYTAAEAAYRHGGPWLETLKIYLRNNRDYLQQSIAQIPGLSMTNVEATYLAWIDARELPVEDPTLFFERGGVGLSNGREFGAERFVRLNFGCPKVTLDRILQKIERAVHELNRH